MKYLLFLILAALATSAFAQPQNYTTGNELRENCRYAVSESDADHITARAGLCIGFIDGFQQFEQIMDIAMGARAANLGSRLICVPDGVTNGQAVKVVVRYLDQHPESLHKFAGLLVYEALTDAFPCPAAPAKPAH
jgi:hypothetical protein